MTDPSDNDGRLLAAWHARRDEAAFRLLCERHANLVLAACRRQHAPDADEAAQAVFLVLARRAGTVAGASLAGWLTLTARRVVAHQRRAAAAMNRPPRSNRCDNPTIPLPNRPGPRRGNTSTRPWPA
jgi:DNA-directed RNA polymerase specialized sigma24 family protein